MSQNSWQEHINHVTAKGVLAKPLYVIFTKPANGLDAVREHLAEHLRYQKDLEARGITFGAGPFANDSETEWSGEGMVIVRAASMQEARALAEADPMHRSGARTFLVRPWLLNEGSYTVTVRYSEPFRTVT
ncbi:YciI family protein [Hydrogenophaga sp. PAMC20947]|uniref:YciI family protein n=1 Tax=Hydrogenophaga sp. PAMC20947 TaxID=2565558 RepID=UPI00109E2CB8|nr:YciI family protein [Hydrogenophaga sp. PAMC20947]QCB46861.1 hypothetical protein E5678_13020 [Hydrogenophaga sp. PAMC20947]